MDSGAGSSGGQRFRRLPRHSLAHLKLDPLVSTCYCFVFTFRLCNYVTYFCV